MRLEEHRSQDIPLDIIIQKHQIEKDVLRFLRQEEVQSSSSWKSLVDKVLETPTAEPEHLQWWVSPEQAYW